MKFLLRNKEGIGLDQGLEKFSVKSFAGHIGSLSYSLFGIFSIKSSLKMQKKTFLVHWPYKNRLQGSLATGPSLLISDAGEQT